jgi:hypothetical protein
MNSKGKNINKLTIIRLKILLLNEGMMDHINDCVKKTGAEVAGSDYCKNWCRCTVHQAKIYRLALKKISDNYSLKSSSGSLSVE